MGVACRLKWNFPASATVNHTQEVISYPECGYGKGQSASAVPATFLPSTVGKLTSLTTSHSGITGTAKGFGHLSYDLWITSSAGVTSGNRVGGAEIMLPVKQLGGYGTYLYRNPAFKTGLKLTVDGKVYDIVHAQPGQQGWQWHFVVFQPQAPAGDSALTVNWKPFFNYAKSQGWINDNQYVSAIELGLEVTPQTSQTNKAVSDTYGDLTIRNFKVTGAKL